MLSQLNMFTYSVCSIGVAIGVVVKAYYQYHQFFPTFMYLQESKACHLIFVNFIFVILLYIGKFIKNFFLGNLRDNEMENIQDRLWPTIIDTLFAMTVFQEEFKLNFFIWYGVLLAVKIFHWLATERVDFMSRSLSLGNVTYIRLISLMIILSVIDVIFLLYAGNEVWTSEPSMMLLFAFEYGILTVFMLSLFVKFFINAYDLYNSGRWESKGVWTMYLDFTLDMVNLMIYGAFFLSLMKNYGLPIHLIRQLYLSFTSFQKRLLLITRYHKVTRDIDRRFPMANARQLSGERADVCIVCREPMESGRVLPCRHILHGRCLLSWLERSQNCPICRVSLLTENQQHDAALFYQQQQQQHPNNFHPPHHNHNNPIPPNNNNNNNPHFNDHFHHPDPGFILPLPQQQPQQPYPYPPHPQQNPIPPPTQQHPQQQQQQQEPLPPQQQPQPQQIHSPQNIVTEEKIQRPVQNNNNSPGPDTLSDINRIEAQVSAMQEQFCLLQEQFAVLLSDLHNYKRTNKHNNNIERTAESAGGLGTKSPSSERASDSIQDSNQTNSTPPSEKNLQPGEDPENNKNIEEIRKRRVLKFSSEHPL